mgnify:CR=1 FL=1|jgi:hypothetical protein
MTGDPVVRRWRGGAPRVDDCPAGGAHAPIPVQGGGGMVCAKCNQRC